MQPFTNFGRLSPQNIKDLINHAAGSATITPRYSLLDLSLNPVQTNTTGLTGDAADITKAVLPTGVSIQNDTTRSVHRSIDLKLSEEVLTSLGVNFNPVSHLIRVFVDYWSPNNEVPFEACVGTFRFIFPDRDLQDSGNTWTLAGLDPSSFIKECNFENSYIVKFGTHYTDAVSRILQMDYIEKSQGGTGTTPAGLDDAGPNIPLSRLNLGTTALTLPMDVPFGREVNKLDAVNQLLAGCAFWPLWVDEVCVFHTGPKPYYTTSGAPTTTWDYITNASSIIKAGVTEALGSQSSDLANVIVLEASNTATTPIVSIKRNISTQSYISRPNLHRSVMKYIADSQIPDQATCDLVAGLELQKAAQLAEQVTFTTKINPLHQSHDYLNIQITSLTGTSEIVSTNNPFEEISWTINFDTMEMTHVCQRAIAV